MRSFALFTQCAGTTIVLKTINELQAEVAFYQNIIKESFLDDSNS